MLQLPLGDAYRAHEGGRARLSQSQGRLGCHRVLLRGEVDEYIAILVDSLLF